MAQARMRAPRRFRPIALLTSMAALGLAVGSAPVEAGADDLGDARAIDVTIAGDTGSGTIDPGLACAEGGDGGYWHYDYESSLPPGVITGPENPLTGDARLRLDVHSEDHVVRATPGEPQDGAAWLQGTESAVTLANQRGTVRLDLRSIGDDDGVGEGCATPHNLDFDGLTASGSGLVWEITETTGSYREAVGAGTAALTASVGPGADNPFELELDGDIAVLQPGLKLEVVDSYWAFLGAHYLLRWVTVAYRVTNTGPGDAFGVRLVAADSPTQGVKLVGPIPFDTKTRSQGPVPQYLADIPAGQSEIVRLRWELPFPAGDPPCGDVILGCEFDSRLTFEMPDALDVVEQEQTATVRTKAPDFPPPVVD